MVDMKLEVVVLPVGDVDRARHARYMVDEQAGPPGSAGLRAST